MCSMPSDLNRRGHVSDVSGSQAAGLNWLDASLELGQDRPRCDLIRTAAALSGTAFPLVACLGRLTGQRHRPPLREGRFSLFI